MDQKPKGGSKPIKEWLKANGRRRDWLAKQLGCTSDHLSVIDCRRASPSSIMASAIERVTGIPASAWGLE